MLKRPVDEGATAAYATIGFAGELGYRQEADPAAGLGARRVADHEVTGVRWVELRDPEKIACARLRATKYRYGHRIDR
jgi:hypothetical protein